MTATRSRKLTAAAAAAGAIAAFLVTTPQASAEPSGDLFNLINDAHVAAGCAPYGHNKALGDVSLQYAQTLARNNGKLQPNTVSLLQGKGYDPNFWGEMDYFNPNGATPQDAFDFWMANNTKDLIPNCDITQMDVSVWIQDGKFGASSIMGTAKGATPPAGSPNPGNGTPPVQPQVGSGGPDPGLLAAVNDARLHPEKYPPRGNTAGAKMDACPNAFNGSGSLDQAASAHNSYIASQGKNVNPHQNASGILSWDAGGPIELAGYNSARAEIVAEGQGSANAAVVAWMQDDGDQQWGHRNIILDCNLSDAGAAHLAGGPWGNYWTVDAGTR
jgi:Cysteine-rich secretory protein family